MTETEAREIMARVTTVKSIAGLAGVDIAIEVRLPRTTHLLIRYHSAGPLR